MYIVLFLLDLEMVEYVSRKNLHSKGKDTYTYSVEVATAKTQRTKIGGVNLTTHMI